MSVVCWWQGLQQELRVLKKELRRLVTVGDQQRLEEQRTQALGLGLGWRSSAPRH